MIPRFTVETLFMYSLYEGSWAYKCYIFRIITTVIYIFIIAGVVVSIPIVEDGTTEISLAISLNVVINGFFICLDFYFASIYYYYWRYPYLRVDRDGKGPNREKVDLSEYGIAEDFRRHPANYSSIANSQK